MNAAPDHYARTQSFHDLAARERQGFYDWNPAQGGAPRHSRWQARARGLVCAALRDLAARQPLASLLDVGCGKGDFSRELGKAFPGATVTGVDFSADMVALAREGADAGLDFRVAALPDLDLDGTPFDVVVCLNVFHHVQTADQARALGSMVGQARRAVVIEIKNARCPYKQLPRGRWLDARTRVFPTTVRAVRAIAQAHGFRVAQARPLFGIDLLSPIVVLTLGREGAS